MKKLEELNDSKKNFDNMNKDNSIIILGSFGGRIDHSFSTVHCVFRFMKEDYYNILNNTEIYMISSNNISVLLKKGVNIIKTHIGQKMEYSIIPIFGEGQIRVINDAEQKSIKKV